MKFPRPLTCFKIAAIGLVAQQSAELIGRTFVNPQAKMGVAQDCKIWPKSGPRILYSNSPLPEDVQSARNGSLKLVVLNDYHAVTKRCVEDVTKYQSADLYRLYLQDRDLHTGKIHPNQINGVVQTYNDAAGNPIDADIPLGNKWFASEAVKAIKEQDARLQSREQAYARQTGSLDNLGHQSVEWTKKAATGLVKITFGWGS